MEGFTVEEMQVMANALFERLGKAYKPGEKTAEYEILERLFRNMLVPGVRCPCCGHTEE